MWINDVKKHYSGRLKINPALRWLPLWYLTFLDTILRMAREKKTKQKNIILIIWRLSQKQHSVKVAVLPSSKRETIPIVFLFREIKMS